MQRRARYAIGAALVIGVTTSCSDSPSAPSNADGAHDVSTAIAQTIAVTFGTYFPGTDAAGLPTACPYSAAASEFVCAPAGLGQLSYTLRYQLLDGDGQPLGAPSERAATIRAVVDVHGTRTATTGGETVTTEVVDHGEMVVSGLHTQTRTLSGTKTSHYEVRSTGGSVPHSVLDGVGEIRNVLFDDGAPWPRAGTVTGTNITTFDASGPVSPKTSRLQSTIEFDGTSVVTITTVLDGSTVRCRFDLAGRTATTCS